MGIIPKPIQPIHNGSINHHPNDINPTRNRSNNPHGWR